MKIAIPKETAQYEARVAGSPETVKKFVALGFSVTVEAGAGVAAGFSDADFTKAGAKVEKDFKATTKSADILLKVQAPSTAEMGALKKGTHLFGILSPLTNKDVLSDAQKANVTAFSMEFMPRITRAQSMDVLSSQSNLAGYRAVLEASHAYGRALPMMMTAAGTVPPAKVLVIGAGVAGLQAIATARRLGAVVSAFDVRAAAKEQVESLGAKFVEVEGAEDMETAGGYAKEASANYKKKQAERMHEVLKKSDICITTALIPGKPAPKLISKAMVKDMKPGSVIVDMAAEMGGNCELTKYAETVEVDGVKILGTANLPSRISGNASALYAKNLFTYVDLLWDKEKKQLNVDLEDEIVKATCLTYEGKVVHEMFASAPAKKPAAKKPAAKKED